MVLVGYLGMAISLSMFGLSRSFLALALSRSLSGGMGGVWALVTVPFLPLAISEDAEVLWLTCLVATSRL